MPANPPTSAIPLRRDRHIWYIAGKAGWALYHSGDWRHTVVFNRNGTIERAHCEAFDECIEVCHRLSTPQAAP